MNPTNLYDHISFNISKLVVGSHSSSFSIAISFLDQQMQDAFFSIYGFVRFADEIVDSFNLDDKEVLLKKFESDYYEAFRTGISLNPVRYSFQKIVKCYQIPDDLLQASIMKLDSAFQKVNFFRDLKNDAECLDRQYFPEMTNQALDDMVKNVIMGDIEKDFSSARTGILNLPKDAGMGVLIAFYYYKRSLRKIRNTPATKLSNALLRISGSRKMALLVKAQVVNKLIMI